MSIDSDTLQAIINGLAFAMVLLALGGISVGAIQRMVRLYQMQSLALALLTILIAADPRGTQAGTRKYLFAFAVLIPGMLAYVIRPLLAQATVPQENVPWTQRLTHPFLRPLSRRYAGESTASIRDALPVWLEHGLSSSRQVLSVTISLFLVGFAFSVAFRLLEAADFNRAWGLAVSMTLLMLGIFTMVNRRDLISQIMGLLIMDHGLFLAAVRVISHPSLIPTFVVSLFLYILITLVILVILLPELHEQSDTIEVAEQKQLRG